MVNDIIANGGNSMTICVIVHGVQIKLAEGYSVEFVNCIKKFLPQNLITQITFHAFNWSILLEEREKYLFDVILSGMNKRKIRSIMSSVWADELWYNRTKKSDTLDTYHTIHQKLKNEIESLRSVHGNDTKIVLIGHSWGSQISLDAIFENIGIIPISGLITLGSPIAYQSGAFLNGGEPPKLDFFYNFWNTNDPVSTILSRINDKWKNSVNDIQVKSFNPFNWLAIPAHTYYWKSGQVQKNIAEILTTNK